MSTRGSQPQEAVFNRITCIRTADAEDQRSKVLVMLLTDQEIVMSGNSRHNRRNDPREDQDQDQKQNNLQAQLQGQGQLQGQAQGQAQLAVQSLDSSSENDNDNDNKNDNKNSNSNENDLDNKVDNKLANSVESEIDSDLDNKIENRVENVVDNKVNVDVDIDLDLSADGLSSPVIDLSGLKDIEGSIIMPDVVNQSLTGNGNQFNIDQVNNLVDNDWMADPKVSFDGGDFRMDAKAEGGDIKLDSEIGDIVGDAANGVTATADAILTQEAFNQTITQGANIQFNSITMNVAGNDLSDSHDLG